MDIPLDAEVRCAGEVCGTSLALVLDPTKEKATHIVVRERNAPHRQRLVPMELVSSADENGIDLSCPKEELAVQEEFIETELLHVTVPHYVNAGFYYSMPYVLREPETEAMEVEEEQIPKGELAVKRGASVEASDGHVGKVDEFVVDPDTDAITHLVMREGHLWGKKDVSIPVSAIDHYAEKTVYLKLSRTEISKLPELSIQRGVSA